MSSSYSPEYSEADLLTELLGLLDNNGTFKLGMLMGVMSKGNLEHIRKLEFDTVQLKEQVATLQVSLTDAESDLRRAEENAG